MSGNKRKYELIIRYLKGLLSNRQKHDLERDMMRDTFDEEAFEGLGRLSADELETDMGALMDRLDNRVKPAKKRLAPLFYRIAAALVILVGIGGILYLLLRPPAPKLVAEKTTPEIQGTPAIPAKSVVSDSLTVQQDKPARVTSPKQEMPPPPEIKQEEINENVQMEAATASEARIPAESAIQASPVQVNEKAARRAMTTDQPLTGTLKGKIVDQEGLALPGVYIVEQGTNQATVSGMDGTFSLRVADNSSKLDLNSIGYKPVELTAAEANGTTITMQEDLLALDEVVVVGYGTQKRSDVTGAVSVIRAEEVSPEGEVAPYIYFKPVPPGGSLKAFKKWVNDRLDYSKFSAFPGKNKIQVTLTVKADGSVTDIESKQTEALPIADELKQAIAQSPPWQPALKEDTPVNATIVIRFVITVE